jgi:hypothetical protein
MYKFATDGPLDIEEFRACLQNMNSSFSSNDPLLGRAAFLRAVVLFEGF